MHSLIVDMGTTNTTLALVDGKGHIVKTVEGSFGVKDRATTGDKEVLVMGLRGLVREIELTTGEAFGRVERLLCSGMITSEVGLITIPHCLAPVSAPELASQARQVDMPEVAPYPLTFFPGIRNVFSGSGLEALEQMDFMRGEETQAFGAVDLYQISLPATLVFLSSHTKLVDVDEQGRITRSFTTLSGQLFDALRYQTLLASSLPADNPDKVDTASLFQGVEAGLKQGLARSGLMVRFMDTLIETSPQERFSFLEGLIIAGDIQAIQSGYPFLRDNLHILGKGLRAQAYLAAFGRFLGRKVECSYLGPDSMSDSAVRGALLLESMM